MFIAGLVIIAPDLQQPKCPGMEKLCCVHIVEYYTVIKKIMKYSYTQQRAENLE